MNTWNRDWMVKPGHWTLLFVIFDGKEGYQQGIRCIAPSMRLSCSARVGTYTGPMGFMGGVLSHVIPWRVGGQGLLRIHSNYSLSFVCIGMVLGGLYGWSICSPENIGFNWCSAGRKVNGGKLKCLSQTGYHGQRFQTGVINIIY